MVTKHYNTPLCSLFSYCMFFKHSASGCISHCPLPVPVCNYR
uniref:Uncharacterized protein n=1 Tax=Anguilla anguilla TaxID=7936 RepID=A0A0E9Q858_ANGAN